MVVMGLLILRFLNVFSILMELKSIAVKPPVFAHEMLMAAPKLVLAILVEAEEGYLEIPTEPLQLDSRQLPVLHQDEPEPPSPAKPRKFAPIHLKSIKIKLIELKGIDRLIE